MRTRRSFMGLLAGLLPASWLGWQAAKGETSALRFLADHEEGKPVRALLIWKSGARLPIRRRYWPKESPENVWAYGTGGVRFRLTARLSQVPDEYRVVPVYEEVVEGHEFVDYGNNVVGTICHKCGLRPGEGETCETSLASIQGVRL